MVRRTYLERGQPVTVITRWSVSPACDRGVTWHRPPKRNAPRNVLIERPDGSLTVRPSRGLRLPHAAPKLPGSLRHPDEVYKVTLCLSCRHPGGQHVLGAGCRLCSACSGWNPAPVTSAWSDRMTTRAGEAP